MADNYTVQIDLEIIDAEETEMILEKFTGTDGKDGKSAYQYAVEHGYTGTEEEFAEYMANAAEYSEHIQETVDDAIQDALDSGDFVPDMEIGTVQTVPHGQSASATITGTKSNPVLNLNIPQGASGNETIDDTAGFGDDDLVWSADKTLKEVDSKADAIYKTIDTPASIITIEDGADDLPVKEMKIAIEPVQEGTGDPSQDNVRPITGWTGCRVMRTGQNLFDINYFAEHYQRSGVSEVLRLLMTLEPNTDYIVSSNAPQTTSFSVCFAWGGATISTSPRTDRNGVGVLYTRTITTDENGHMVVGIYGENDKSIETYEALVSGKYYLLVEPAESSVLGKTYPITFPSEAGTVYGGELTIHADGTGELAIEYHHIIYNRDTYVNSSGQSAQTGKYWMSLRKTMTGEYIPYGNTPDSGDEFGIFSHGPWKYTYPSAWRGYARTPHVFAVVTSAEFELNTAEGRTAFWDDFESKGQDMEIVFKLATPIPYQLTAPQVRTLLSLNHIRADTGDIKSITYPVDGASAMAEVDGKVTTTQGMIAGTDSPVATESHAVGDVFICENKLIRATDAIAVGESVIIGSNAEVINLADFIREVAAQAQTNNDLLAEKTLALGLTPLNRYLFPIYQKGIQVGTGANSRTADVFYNVIRSEGNPELSGSTYLGVIMTADEAVHTSNQGNAGFQMYKSWFKHIEPPVVDTRSYKLICHVSNYLNKGGKDAVPSGFLFTYDSEGIVKRSYMSFIATPTDASEGYCEETGIVPNEFIQNGNICVGVNFRNPNQSLERKIWFEWVHETMIPEGTYVISDPTALTNPVQDDLT